MDKDRIKREPNPQEEASFLSKLFFVWTGKIFRRGMQANPMSSDELYKPLSCDTSVSLGDRLESNWFIELENAKLAGRKPRLLYAVARTFGWEYARLGIMHGINELILRISQPILLGMLLSYFQPNSDVSREFALQIAGLLITILFVSTIIQNHFGLGGFHFGMKVRIACCSVIYRKALRLSRTALNETATGQVVNLLSNDVSRFDIVLFFLHYVWSAPIGAIFITYLLWSAAGVSGLIGIISIFIIIPLQAYAGKLASKFRRQTAHRTDERVRLMDEIIGGIQVIKMYAWEKPFAKLISTARAKELKMLKRSSYVRGVYMTFNLFNTRLAMYSTMLALSLFGQKLSADNIFVYASFYNMLSFTMGGAFVRAFGEIAETLVSLQRLTKFLLHDEYVDRTSAIKGNSNISGKEYSGEIVLSDVTARWNPSLKEPTLKDICLKLPTISLTAIVGSVGCGKSSLLQVLLGELPFEKGKISVSGRVSYASQEPWVFAASVRQNITFGLPYNRIRYSEVIKACALESDFAQWPQRDKTVVGERGTSLSGGQRARINLARAVYKDADIYLLDDPLSAVDTHVGKHLFEECINGFLRDKTRVLVTHQLQYLEAADHMILLNNGEVQVQGTFEQLLHSDSEFAQLLARVEEEVETEHQKALSRETSVEEEQIIGDGRMSRHMSTSSVGGRSSRTSRSLDLQASQQDLAALPMEEVKIRKGSSLIGYFTSGANCFVLFILSSFFILAQTAASFCDYWVSIWTTNDAMLWELKSREMSLNKTETNATNVTMAVNNTTKLNFDEQNVLSTEMCQYINTGLIIGLFLVAISRSVLFFNTCMNCSQKLHDNMFKRVSETYLSFFHDNPSGRILNRFSKDLGSLDELLPKALLDAGQIIIVVLGGIIVTCTVNYLFIFPVALVSAFCWMARVIFLNSSRNIKRIEGITRSPVFTHLNATLQGLTTIRAYNAQDILKTEFDHHQDLHTSAWYLFITTSTAFGFTLDFLCFVLIVSVTFILLLLDADFPGGMVGLAITQTMALSGMVQWGMRQSAEVTNQLTSVERVLEYTDMEGESHLDEHPDESAKEKQLETWPQYGKIEFRTLFLYYKVKETPAIKGLTVTIEAGAKVGIIGRTGAGKTSIISALFRLAPIDGLILIDGVDTSKVSLNRLRAHISIIPQEPVLFSGTIRRNLDPFQLYRDADLWKALEEVELKDALTHGLDTAVLDGGSNFSVGQKQLLCLARAILRNNKILLMDEATASVDPHTDSLIQKTIRQKFKNCTVCTIAHRLNTIIDSDRVLVMDYGKMVEYDEPHILLKNDKGFFSKLVEETGPVMAEQLKKSAEEHYYSSKKF